MAQPKIDKDFCYMLLCRGLRPKPSPIVFKGLAKDYPRFDDPSFQALVEKHSITPQTEIVVSEQAEDSFVVRLA